MADAGRQDHETGSDAVSAGPRQGLQPMRMAAAMRPTAPAAGRACKIVVFGFDSAEISQVRRIRSLMALGHDVHAFTMRRGTRSGHFETEFPNTHLFWTEHERLVKRAVLVAAAIVKMTGHRACLRAADMILARNLDMLCIAWAARRLAGAGDVPLVYECLDIHKAMVGEGRKTRALRRAERWLLDRCQGLVVSSPAYLHAYFEACQAYRGPAFLCENKIVPIPPLPDRQSIAPVPATGPIRIGWIGSIRCRPSLHLLQEVARALGPRVEIHIHGRVHDHAVPEFHSVVAETGNMVYHGPYDYPSDLPEVYAHCDLVWNVDLWLRGGNSDWALANRLYEAGWCGRPSIGLENTETGRYIAERGMGWVLPAADPAQLARLLREIDRERIQGVSRALLSRPASDFVSDGSELQAIIDRLVHGNAPSSAGTRT